MHTGGGKVTGTENGDENGAYEVEVTKDDGTVVDVHLEHELHSREHEVRHRGAGL